MNEPTAHDQDDDPTEDALRQHAPAEAEGPTEAEDRDDRDVPREHSEDSAEG